MTISCLMCGKPFKPKCHRTKMCSKKCAKERRKQRHRSPEYRARNKAGRARRRKENPGAEHASLKRRRPWRAVWISKRSNARKRGILFTLTPEWVERKYKAGCAVTGIAFRMGEGILGPFSPSIDRINPDKGYTPRNCRMVLYGVNALKGTGTDEDMKTIAQAITKEAT